MYFSESLTVSKVGADGKVVCPRCKNETKVELPQTREPSPEPGKKGKKGKTAKSPEPPASKKNEPRVDAAALAAVERDKQTLKEEVARKTIEAERLKDEIEKLNTRVTQLQQNSEKDRAARVRVKHTRHIQSFASWFHSHHLCVFS